MIQSIGAVVRKLSASVKADQILAAGAGGTLKCGKPAD